MAPRLARYALGVDFASLTPDAVGWAKEVLLDTIGCALSGYPAAPARIAREVFEQFGGVAESTVIGGGQRLPCTSTAWINGTMARFQDMNDTFPLAHRIGHFSEVIPTALAVGERARASGPELLASIVAGYEVLAATTFHGAQVGVGFATFGAIASPLVAGKLLGLSEEQMVNAVGISLSSNVTLLTWYGDARASMLKASTWSAMPPWDPRRIAGRAWLHGARHRDRDLPRPRRGQRSSGRASRARGVHGNGAQHAETLRRADAHRGSDRAGADPRPRPRTGSRRDRADRGPQHIPSSSATRAGPSRLARPRVRRPITAPHT